MRGVDAQWFWKIITMFMAMAPPKGDYGHRGSYRGSPKPTGVKPSKTSQHGGVDVPWPPSSTEADASTTRSQSVLPVSSSPPKDTSRATVPSSTASPIPERKCPEGSSWFVFEDPLTSFVNKENWHLDAANGAKINFEDGMQMTLNQSSLYVTLTTLDSWVAPVTVEAEIKATGVGGVPSAFVMKGPADAGAEIDLEIASYQLKGQSKPTYQMQLPIWKPSGQKGKYAIVLKKDGSELTATTANGCREDKGNPAMGGWAYTYDGYDPRRWTKYKLEWFEDYIRWYSEGLERATFRKEKDSTYPSTPLPMAAGPWAVSKESNPEVGWAGAMDWKANPNPSMSLKNVRIAGCRAKAS